MSMSQPASNPAPDPAQTKGLRVVIVDDEAAWADLVGSYPDSRLGLRCLWPMTETRPLAEHSRPIQTSWCWRWTLDYR